MEESLPACCHVMKLAYDLTVSVMKGSLSEMQHRAYLGLLLSDGILDKTITSNLRYFLERHQTRNSNK